MMQKNELAVAEMNPSNLKNRLFRSKPGGKKDEPYVDLRAFAVTFLVILAIVLLLAFSLASYWSSGAFALLSDWQEAESDISNIGKSITFLEDDLNDAIELIQGCDSDGLSRGKEIVESVSSDLDGLRLDVEDVNKVVQSVAVASSGGGGGSGGTPLIFIGGDVS